jgi:hypothetical protein
MDSSLRPLFFDLARACEQASGLRIKRTHTYQLLASAFGFGSWEALRTRGVLADGIGDAPPLQLPAVVGRALQLEVGSGHAVQKAADALLQELRVRDLRSLALSDLFSRALTHGMWPVNGGWEFAAIDDADERWDDEDELDDETASADVDVRREWLRTMRSSSVLRASLSDRAAAGDARCHLVLAALLRCRKPNSYLHDEEQRGRRLNATEKAMKAEFLDSVVRFPAYVHHLQAAASAGIAQAAIECAYALSDDRWLQGADYQGDGDLLLAAAEVARDDAAGTDFLLRGSETGYQKILAELGARGHPAGIEHLASQGDRAALITATATALRDGDAELAWSWQLVAQEYGLDLEDSAAEALHAEGPHAGERYDDDIGGPAYVEEFEVIELPQIQPESLARARKRAEEVVAGARISNRHKERGRR